MEKYFKFLMISIASLLIAGCAARPPKYDVEVLTAIPNESMEGKKYGLFPLDETKVVKIETQMIAGEVIKGLTVTGLRLGALDGVLPNYIFMFDYATELGIDGPYEHVFLLIAYDVSDGRKNQIYKARLKIDSQENNPLKALTPAIESITKKFPNQFQ